MRRPALAGSNAGQVREDPFCSNRRLGRADDGLASLVVCRSYDAALARSANGSGLAIAIGIVALYAPGQFFRVVNDSTASSTEA